MKNILFLLPLLLLASCIEEEIPRLPPNVFAEEDTEFFTILSVEFTTVDFDERTARVEFESIYNQLSTELKDEISGIVVDGPGISRGFAADRTHFVTNNIFVGTRACYTIRFSGASSSRTEFCFDVE
ncbi:hypothetical protein [Lewinella sp. W8]|uniref:hypothetical protein n=1 Tax=Lewinella sp. W8 TaxID=2528208 RepID=UPI0010673B78|nr:hypothetical protein [Lewinella sp. W8]MTB53440.1 hypothetical protein [Lewinella sp. W8]